MKPAFAAILLGASMVVASGVCAAAEEAAGPNWVAGGSLVLGKPSALGAEASFASLFLAVPQYRLFVGPKLGALYAWAEDGAKRFDLSFGVSETLWLVNAVGSGLDLEIIAPSTISGQDAAVHFRVTPSLAIRLFHFGETGAWAVRVGVPYDTHYKWGVQAGVTLQLNGVASIGRLIP